MITTIGSETQKLKFDKYIQAASLKSDLDRTELAKEKNRCGLQKFCPKPGTGKANPRMGGRLRANGIWNGQSCCSCP
jgi:hypothetical protein